MQLLADVRIKLEKIQKIFVTTQGTITALEDINLRITDGEFFCIVGPSGCGKTTLLRILAGLETITVGNMTIKARDTSRPLNSMVFQEQSVFPWMTVTENVEYGLRMRKMPKPVRRDIANHYIEMIGLKQFAASYPCQLSGGMKQRVSVARAFANDPEILLMDEPFGSLDEQNRILLQKELLRIWEGTSKTTVFITHSIDEALCLGDRILVMSARPGTIKTIVPVTLPRPRDVETIRTTPQYIELYQTIWSQLRDEVLKGETGIPSRR
ncbi:ABC transporter ATP-binding protein [Acetonema longum]|uniref:ABC transporter ATP-binding protein n=1 Tax=Acetonema longum TaxID=2374 RepID=UPI0039B7444B